MSSTSSSPTPTSSESPPATSTETSSGGFSPPSSTLYLLTFLATLFVLLFVSCAIVLRSFILRRRFRRQIEQQIAAGILPPEAALHFRNGVVDFGEKPRLWDVAISATSGELVSSWNHLAPVSARLLIPRPEESPKLIQRRPSAHRTFARLLTRNRPRPPAEPPAIATVAQPSDDLLVPPYKDGTPVQVAVFVQMPTANSRTQPCTSAEAAHIPEISIGVASIPLRADG